MKFGSRRATPSPCIICTNPISEDQLITFCPDCGEPYHNATKSYDCWRKIGKRCKVRGCHGRTYFLWPRIENRLLKYFGISRTKLVSTCSNCGITISPLDRYCTKCGYDINNPNVWESFFAYSLTKWIRYNHRYIFAISCAVILLVIIYGGTFLVNAAQNFTQQRQTAIASYPTPTRTKVIVITTLMPISTPKPSISITSTNIPRATKTNIPRPTKIPSNSIKETDFPTRCPGAPTIRVKIDELARVTYTDGTPLRLRSSPDTNSKNIIERLPEGTHFKIIYGPVCADNFAFWQVKVKSTGIKGWVAEGDRINYFIETVR